MHKDGLFHKATFENGTLTVLRLREQGKDRFIISNNSGVVTRLELSAQSTEAEVKALVAAVAQLGQFKSRN